MNSRYYKITPVNGFDQTNSDNAMQNNYAWSMAELGNYIYVGTGRNIVYQPLSIGQMFGISPPPILTPQNPQNNAEIWRYNKYTSSGWERVYQAPGGLELMGFRFMIAYTDNQGITALYAAGFTITNAAYMLSSTDGVNWEFINPGVPAGFSTRTMLVHNGRLYLGATNTLQESETTYLYVTDNPRLGWQQVPIGISPNDPRGEVISMASFNGQLYLGTAPYGGFEIWRTQTGVPDPGSWRLVVDKGAGDALNELPLSMAVFGQHLYVGTGIWVSVLSVDPRKRIVPPKGFDIIRINTSDQWQVVVGQEALWPTIPTTGMRTNGFYASGFGNLFNSYCWQLTPYGNRLYVGSWDSSILWATLFKNLFNLDMSTLNSPDALLNISLIQPEILQNIVNALSSGILASPDFRSFRLGRWLAALLCSLKTLPCSFGFDFFSTRDGLCFKTISCNGLNNPYNYGLRTMLASEDNRLYIGTANPFQGCEVWMHYFR